MRRKVIEIIYNNDKDGKKHLIDHETEEYYYMTDGFTGEEKRYHKTKQTFEFKDQNGSWQLYSDWQSITQANIIQ